MLKTRFTASSGVATHRAAWILAILVPACLIVSASPAYGVEVPLLYTAQVALDQKEDDPRASAYDTALADVLLRVSGSELSADPEMIELLFPDPAAYVVQFRSGVDDTLWVSFDGRAIEKTLRQAGQTVWDSDRPLTLIWIAVDWGQGEREIIAANDPHRSRDAARSIDRNRLLRQRVLDVAERRGLPVMFPLLDTDDLQNISFSDIWGGFDAQVLAASKRYNVSSILIGRVRAASGQGSRWSYYLSGAKRSWIGEPELVVRLVADMLAAEFAISGNTLLESIELSVGGIDSVAAYGAVQNLLSGMSVIESFAITEVHGDEIRYRVETHGGAERLRRALQFNGLIEQDRLDDDRFSFDRMNASLNFFYNPNN
ncbi:MAG: DUF2066 domain-containing protein [Proteobacteria bacterium]|nr:DUF2066 domain-containing protein [Pseudomonadota bacterium]